MIRYKYRFIPNRLLFSSSMEKDTSVIFITTNGLNDPKEILTNRKLFQGIGIIHTSEIEKTNVKTLKIIQTPSKKQKKA